jgi:hypothetical protein
MVMGPEKAAPPKLSVYFDTDEHTLHKYYAFVASA